MRKLNVLIFPAGTEVGLEIYSSLKDCKGINLFGAGDSFVNHGPYVFSNYSVFPLITDHDFLSAINNFCEENKIDYIFPAYDDVVLYLVENKQFLFSQLIAPRVEACEICRYKSKTYLALKDLVPTPRVYSKEEVFPFPVFIKPDRGQGSQGAQLIKNEAQLNLIENLDNYIISEYLPGDEYTVDCFSDADFNVCYAGPRVRNRMRNGIAVNSSPYKLDGIDIIASAISKNLGMSGVWFFQVKRDINGDLKLLEVAPRIAGSMSVNRMLGVNFALMSLYMYEGFPVGVVKNNYNFTLDRSLCNAYIHDIDYEKVYIDFDDVIYRDGKLCVKTISFVIQCLNLGKKVILITRHAGDLPQLLDKLKIASLFDSVIHIRDNQLKSDFIDPNKSIFIDDSFSERREVNQTKLIPVFDVDMIDLLIDSRH